MVPSRQSRWWWWELSVSSLLPTEEGCSAVLGICRERVAPRAAGKKVHQDLQESGVNGKKHLQPVSVSNG